MSSSNEAAISAALVERILKGEKQAETEMVQRYHNGLICILGQYSRNSELTEDIAQETWKIVLQKVRGDTLKERDKLRAYIIGTGKSQLLMSYRKEKGKTFVDESDVELVCSSAAEPQKILERSKTTELVKNIISKLTKPRDRELLTRVYFDQESKDTIRQEYDLSELHLNRVLHRARQRFKKLWNNDADNKN